MYVKTTNTEKGLQECNVNESHSKELYQYRLNHEAIYPGKTWSHRIFLYIEPGNTGGTRGRRVHVASRADPALVSGGSSKVPGLFRR